MGKTTDGPLRRYMTLAGFKNYEDLAGVGGLAPGTLRMWNAGTRFPEPRHQEGVFKELAKGLLSTCDDYRSKTEAEVRDELRRVFAQFQQEKGSTWPALTLSQAEPAGKVPVCDVPSTPGRISNTLEPAEERTAILDERPERRSGARKGTPTQVEDLATLKAKIQEALQRALALTRALAEELSWDEKDAESIVDVLLDMSAQEVASIFAELVRVLDRAGLQRDRDVARILLWQILPLLGDWRDIIDKAREHAAGAVLELHLRTETVAEIVLAGIDARSCQWAPGDHFPQGSRHVPFPAAAQAPLFDPRGHRLQEAVEAVFIHLREERASRDDVWSKVKKRWPLYSAFKRAAVADMKQSAKRGEPFYMLVIDEELDADKKRDSDQSWRVVQEAIGGALPQLRLVRLTGGEVEMDGEIDLAPIIRDVRDT